MASGKIMRYAAMLRSGEITSVKLTEAYLEKISVLNPEINAYVSVNAEKALASAKEADAMISRGEGDVLTGIPFGIKDNIATKGEETTCCSRILKGYRPTYNATVYERLIERGAVVLGKNNMDEFAMGSSTETSCYGAAYNPHDKGHVPGGSSGGGAAAVAAGLAVYTLGSDTGGSIRQPAAFCGVVGLKPTYGAVSRYGLIAYGSSLDQIGPIASSVEDAAIVFDAIKGADKRDQTSSGGTEPTVDKLDGNVKGLRIGIAEEYFDGISADTLAGVRKAIDFYAGSGAEIVKVSLPMLKDALPVYYIIACAEASSNLGRYDGIRYGYRAARYDDVNDMIMRTRSEGFGREVKRRIMLGTYVLSSGYFDAYYKKALRLRESIVTAFTKIFAECDVLIAPVAPTTAFPVNYTADNMIETYMSDICTVPVNIAGLPAISVPCGKDGKNLPVGMQIIGKKFDELTVLRAAYAYERAGLTDVSLDTGVTL